jgi:hypothetical protein
MFLFNCASLNRPILPPNSAIDLFSLGAKIDPETPRSNVGRVSVLAARGGDLMPAKKDQASPNLRQFNQKRKWQVWKKQWERAHV